MICHSCRRFGLACSCLCSSQFEQAQGIFVPELGRDGNCACYTSSFLKSDDPYVEYTGSDLAVPMRERMVYQDNWRRVRNDPGWQQFFNYFKPRRAASTSAAGVCGNDLEAGIPSLPEAAQALLALMEANGGRLDPTQIPEQLLDLDSGTLMDLVATAQQMRDESKSPIVDPTSEPEFENEPPLPAAQGKSMLILDGTMMPDDEVPIPDLGDDESASRLPGRGGASASRLPGRCKDWRPSDLGRSRPPVVKPKPSVVDRVPPAGSKRKQLQASSAQKKKQKTTPATDDGDADLEIVSVKVVSKVPRALRMKKEIDASTTPAASPKAAEPQVKAEAKVAAKQAGTTKQRAALKPEPAARAKAALATTKAAEQPQPQAARTNAQVEAARPDHSADPPSQASAGPAARTQAELDTTKEELSQSQADSDDEMPEVGEENAPGDDEGAYQMPDLGNGGQTDEAPEPRRPARKSKANRKRRTKDSDPSKHVGRGRPPTSTLQSAKEEEVGLYLASILASWPAHRVWHRELADENGTRCFLIEKMGAGGYSDLKKLLAMLKMPDKCEICMKFLAHFKFKLAKLRTRLLVAERAYEHRRNRRTVPPVPIQDANPVVEAGEGQAAVVAVQGQPVVAVQDQPSEDQQVVASAEAGESTQRAGDYLSLMKEHPDQFRMATTQEHSESLNMTNPCFCNVCQQYFDLGDHGSTAYHRLSTHMTKRPRHQSNLRLWLRQNGRAGEDEELSDEDEAERLEAEREECVDGWVLSRHPEALLAKIGPDVQEYFENFKAENSKEAERHIWSADLPLGLRIKHVSHRRLRKYFKREVLPCGRLSDSCDDCRDLGKDQKLLGRVRSFAYRRRAGKALITLTFGNLDELKACIKEMRECSHYATWLGISAAILVPYCFYTR